MAHIFEGQVLQIERFYTGLFTFRNPLIVPIRTMGRRIIELYDAMSDGLNMETSNKLTLIRRPGFTPINSTPINGRALWFTTFKPSNFPGQLYNLVDTTQDIEWIQPGNIAPTVLLTKTVPTLTNFATVGAYQYWANSNFMKKWDSPAGVQGLTNWGIDVTTVASPTGPNSPSAGALLPQTQPIQNPPWTSIGPGSGTVTLTRAFSIGAQGPNPPTAWMGMWQHMQNTEVLDGNFASTSIACGALSPRLVAQGFNFSLPANAQILGITVRIVGMPLFPATTAQWRLLSLSLEKAGAAVGQNKGTSVIYNGAQDLTFGGPTDLWGTTWQPSDLNNAEFGIELQVQNASLEQIEMGIDFISISVNYTVPAVSSTLTSQFLYSSGYGFNLPVDTATQNAPEISGFKVQITGLETTGDGIMLNVGLVRNGAIQGFGQTHVVKLPANSSTVTIGGSSDLWNGIWTPNDVNKPTFGVAIQAVNSSAINATYTISGVTVTVYTIQGPGVAAVAPTGSETGITAQIAYQYVQCFGNAYSGHISSPTPPAPETIIVNTGVPGVQPQNQTVLITATISPDPQVTDIHIFRSTDGGGEPFFELPNSPIPNKPDTAGGTTATLRDTAQDWQLQVANIAPQPHFNDPPPQGALDPVWFSGRLWMHKKNLLYFSSGPDITMGNPEESWFPEYVFEIPGAEIIRKFAIPNGMLVFSVDDIFLVRGTSTAAFTVTDFMRDIGIRTWTAGDSDGTNVYVYSTDKQTLLINANGLTSVSQNIADRIQAVDPTLAYVSIFRYTAQQNWLFVGDGSTFIYPFNVEMQCWGLPAAPVNGAGAIATVETQPGVFQFWRARPAVGSLVSFRDTSSFRDEGFAYPCFVIFGAIPTADFLTLSQIRDVVLSTIPTASERFLSVLANEITPLQDKQYQLLQISSSEPPELSATPSLSYRADRYTWMSAPLPQFTNILFLRLDFSADDNPDELLAWTLAGTQTTGGSALGQAGQLPQVQGR